MIENLDATLALLAQKPVVVNIGAEWFFAAPELLSPGALHVRYSPKAGGNDELAAMADALLYSGDTTPEEEAAP